MLDNNRNNHHDNNDDNNDDNNNRKPVDERKFVIHNGRVVCLSYT